MELLMFVYYILAAIGWSFLYYFVKKTGDKEVEFDMQKFVRTLFVGLIVGIGAFMTGAEASYTGFLGVLRTIVTTNIGVIAVVDQLAKLVVKLYKNA